MSTTAARPDPTSRRNRLRRRLHGLVAVVTTLGLTLGLGGALALPAHAAAACADLRVSAYAPSPAAPLAGQSVIVTADVQNVGTCRTGPFVTQLQSVDTDPLYWQPRTTDHLDPGQVTTLRMGLDFPDAGSFVPAVVVDVDDTVDEVDESNNRQVVPLTVRPATVDLALTDVTTNPARPVRGQPMTLTATIRNLGTSTTQSFDVSWSPILFFSSSLTKKVDGLASGASTAVTFAYTYTSYWNFDSYVGVDGQQELTEANEFNNFRNFQVPVDPARPDLVVQGLQLTPSNPLPGQTATAAFVVKNLGSTDAGPFQLRWQPYAQAPILTLQAGGLAAGARRTLTFSQTFPTADVFAGTATVDPSGTVTEVDETNNAIPVTVPVAPNATNLTMFASVREATVSQLKPIHVDVQVWNRGNTGSGPFDVTWNPDTKGALGAGDRTLTQNVGNLGRGEKRTVAFEYAYSKEGDFASVATADGLNRVVETSDRDNARAIPVRVSEPDIDLEVTGFTLTPTQPLQGGLTTATITVRNTGTIAAGAFVVQWKLPASSGTNPRATVRGIPPGEARQITFGGTFADAGAAETSAVADVFHQVVEPGGEGNNTITKDVTVKAGG